MKGAHSAQAYQ